LVLAWYDRLSLHLQQKIVPLNELASCIKRRYYRPYDTQSIFWMIDPYMIFFTIHNNMIQPEVRTSHTPFLILFDCDGTLMDSHTAIVRAMQKAFCSCGLPEPSTKAVFDVIGLSLGRAIDQLADNSYLAEEIKHAYRDYYRVAEHELKLYPGVRETLQVLRQRGYWLGMVTGKSKAGLLRVLDAFGLQDYFCVLRTADCSDSKPHPAMVRECMAEVGVEATQTCVVGDALFDIQMAHAAGVVALGVLFGVSGSDEPERAGAMAVVNNFSDLLAYFPPLQDHRLSPTMAAAL
jgi:phosphoglycolate phosphatase